MLLYKFILATGCYFMNIKASSPPHIIFIFVDDMGWNDISFHGSPQIPTPNIDALAAGGIILKNYYSCPQCTPSRAALLTGLYPIHTGLQHFLIRETEPMGLPTDIVTFPEHFKKLGYTTHMVGKWHLGSYKKKYLPNHRGFDSFFGYWNGLIDYYDYTDYFGTPSSTSKKIWGVDLHDNDDPVASHYQGQYATEVFTEKATNIISSHNTSQPLFLYLAHLAVHTGNIHKPLQAPPKYVARHSHIKDIKRRTFAGMISALDDSVGRIFQTLKEKEMLDNSIVIFCSDNGAPAAGHKGAVGSNFPFRGMKMSLWQGGVRVPAVIWSPLLNLEAPRISMQMMHVTDWLPTLYSIAEGDVKDLGRIDGTNMWETLIQDSPSTRSEILLNIDPIYGMAALIHGDLKVITGSYITMENDWYGPSGREDIEVSSMDAWVWKDGSLVRDILMETNRWLLKEPDTWRKDAEVKCSNASANTTCDFMRNYCLFNITQDPCEYQNLADQYPEMLESMLERLRVFNQSSVAPLNKPIDYRGDPICHDFAYVSWLDEEESPDCKWVADEPEG